jgi:hypothetical protein
MNQYLPRAAPCEPLLTWPFANALVIGPHATQSSSDRGLTPRLSQKTHEGALTHALRTLTTGGGDDRPVRLAE